MVRVHSSAVSSIGFDPDRRLLAVRFTSSETVYGYPGLSDEEVAALREVLQHGESLGHFISTVIKPIHDDEHVEF